MKFTIGSNGLNKALKTLSPAISTNVVLPILETVKFSVTKKEATITATNLNISIVHTMICESKEDFECVIPFKELYNITSTVAAQPLTITIDKGITVKTNSNIYKLGSIGEAKDFPKVEAVDEGVSFEADEEFLYQMQLATNCVSTNPVDVQFLGVSIEVKDKSIFVLACDRHQLFSYAKPFNDKFENCLVDTGFIKACKPIIFGTLTISKKFIKLSNGIVTVMGRLSEEKFPDTAFMLKYVEYNCKINRAELLSKLNECMVFGSPFYILTLNFENPDEVKIVFDDYDMQNHFESEIKSEHSVAFPQIQLNAATLKNIVSLIPEVEELNIAFASNTSGVRIDTDLNKLMIMPIVPIN